MFKKHLSSSFFPYGNLTLPHWYSLSSSSCITHFKNVLHKANLSKGGNTGEEVGREAIRLRGLGVDQRGGGRLLWWRDHWCSSAPGTGRGASEGHKPVQGELSREQDPGLGASPYPPCSGVQAHTRTHTCVHTHMTHNTCTHITHMCTHDVHVCAHVHT